MSRTYEGKLATLRIEFEQRSLTLSATEAECVQLRSQVASLENELADLSQRFTVLGQTRDEERAIVEAGRAEASKPMI